MRRLGIVIPAYNVAFPLKRLLKQIEEQLTDDVAVVVVDDVPPTTRCMSRNSSNPKQSGFFIRRTAEWFGA